MAALRLFTAIDLPLDLREALCALPPAARGVRPVKAENIHLTLHFIGQAEPEPIVQALAPVAILCSPFEMRLSGVGFFRGRNRSSILWAGVERTPELVQLHSELGATLQRLEIAIDERPFRPHITIARGERVAAEELHDFVDYHADFAATLAVDSFVLYSSDLTKTGPIYNPECRYPLNTPDRL